MRSNSAALLWRGTFVLGLASVGFFVASVRAQLEARSDEGVPYLSGGIGLDERDALRARARDYNLTLSFAEKMGNYLSDVEVVIKDAQGNTVLETVSEGPWFFVKLPAGSYTVIATTMGKTHQATRQGKRHKANSALFLLVTSIHSINRRTSAQRMRIDARSPSEKGTRKR